MKLLDKGDWQAGERTLLHYNSSYKCWMGAICFSG